jgi:hypothetical protein
MNRDSSIEVVRMLSLCASILLLVACNLPGDASALDNTSVKLLVLTETALPAGWQIFPCSPPSKRCSDSEGAVTYGRVDVPGYVLQSNYRIYSVEAAKAYYRHVFDIESNKTPAPPHTPFVPPPEVAYRSPIADDFFLGCGLTKSRRAEHSSAIATS